MDRTSHCKKTGVSVVCTTKSYNYNPVSTQLKTKDT